MFDANPDPRHPRVAIRIAEEDFTVHENVAVVRAPGGEDERGKNYDLNNREDGASHRNVLGEISKSEYRNSKQIRKGEIRNFKTGIFGDSKIVFRISNLSAWRTR